MIKIKFNLLQILTIKSLNVKHQRKKLHSIGILLVSLHEFMKTLKNDMSEVYKAQVERFRV